MVVDSRKEMKSFLQRRMRQSYESVKEDQEFEKEQNKLKSYLIESNTDNVAKRIKKFSNSPIKINETKDDGFFTIKVEQEDEKNWYFLDRIDDRFWSIHTVEKSTATSDFIDNIILPRNTDLDHSWLSGSFLDTYKDSPEKSLEHFSLSFKDEIGSEDEQDAREEVEQMSMQLWGDGATDVLETVKNAKKLRNSTSLKGIKLRSTYGEEVLHDTINWKSKVSSYGESISGHLREIRDIKTEYSKKLNTIENDFALRYNSRDSGFDMEGEPILIRFDKEIKDVEAFAQAIFRGTKPFRLWSTTDRLKEDYIRASAVDTHTGDKVDFEITPQTVRVYLPEGSCGNVVLRMFTNLQKSFDSRTRLIGGNDERFA